MRHIMIMLAICFAMVIGYQQTTPAMESHSVQEITVKSGDTLWDIASRSTASNVEASGFPSVSMTHKSILVIALIPSMVSCKI